MGLSHLQVRWYKSDKRITMNQGIIISVAVCLVFSFGHAESSNKNELPKIQSAVKEFKLKNKEIPLPELTILKKVTDDGLKLVQKELTQIYGSKIDVKQALKDYSSPDKKSKASPLLASNFLRLSNPTLENLNDGLSKKSDFSNDEIQIMEKAFQEIMALSEKMKAYAQRMTPDQIKYIAQDNPNSNIPRLLLWPLGTDKTCTEDMVYKIRDDVGPENFKRLASSMMLTGSAYEALYEPLYLRRAMEILKKDPSEEAKLILAQIIPGLTPQTAEQSYTSFVKYINQGEEEFVRLFGPQLTKQDARVFFQGYARKYPLCLGILSSDYKRIKNKFM